MKWQAAGKERPELGRVTRVRTLWRCGEWRMPIPAPSGFVAPLSSRAFIETSKEWRRLRIKARTETLLEATRIWPRYRMLFRPIARSEY